MEIAGDAPALFGPTGLFQLLVGRPVREGEFEEVPEGDRTLQRVVRQRAVGADDLEHAVETAARGDRDEQGATGESVRCDSVSGRGPDLAGVGRYPRTAAASEERSSSCHESPPADRSEASLDRDRVLLNAQVARRGRTAGA